MYTSFPGLRSMDSTSPARSRRTARREHGARRGPHRPPPSAGVRLAQPRQLGVRQPREQHLVIEIRELLASNHLRCRHGTRLARSQPTTSYSDTLSAVRSSSGSSARPSGSIGRRATISGPGSLARSMADRPRRWRGSPRRCNGPRRLRRRTALGRAARKATFGEQLVVGSTLDDRAALDREDHVSVTDRR